MDMRSVDNMGETDAARTARDLNIATNGRWGTLGMAAIALHAIAYLAIAAWTVLAIIVLAFML